MGSGHLPSRILQPCSQRRKMSAPELVPLLDHGQHRRGAGPDAAPAAPLGGPRRVLAHAGVCHVEHKGHVRPVGRRGGNPLPQICGCGVTGATGAGASASAAPSSDQSGCVRSDEPQRCALVGDQPTSPQPRASWQNGSALLGLVTAGSTSAPRPLLLLTLPQPGEGLAPFPPHPPAGPA